MGCSSSPAAAFASSRLLDLLIPKPVVSLMIRSGRVALLHHFLNSEASLSHLCFHSMVLLLCSASTTAHRCCYHGNCFLHVWVLDSDGAAELGPGERGDGERRSNEASACCHSEHSEDLPRVERDAAFDDGGEELDRASERKGHFQVSGPLVEAVATCLPSSRSLALDGAASPCSAASKASAC